MKVNNGYREVAEGVIESSQTQACCAILRRLVPTDCAAWLYPSAVSMTIITQNPMQSPTLASFS